MKGKGSLEPEAVSKVLAVLAREAEVRERVMKMATLRDREPLVAAISLLALAVNKLEANHARAAEAKLAQVVAILEIPGASGWRNNPQQRIEAALAAAKEGS